MGDRESGRMADSDDYGNVMCDEIVGYDISMSRTPWRIPNHHYIRCQNWANRFFCFSDWNGLPKGEGKYELHRKCEQHGERFEGREISREEYEIIRIMEE
jgi:hypothetical protein